jgi:hypothetical protein
MSGCFCADYINHKIYTYLIEYAYDNDLTNVLIVMLIVMK